MINVKTIILAGLIATGTIQAERPNVLFVAIDDMRNFAGCFGYEQVQTPYIDWLSGISTVFLNAHNQAPMCGPSRASVMSGIQPYNSGAYGFVDWRKVPVLADSTQLNKHFKDAGYYTMSGGKINHGNTHRLGDWDEIYAKAQHSNGTWGEKEIKPEDRALQEYQGLRACGPSELPEEVFHDTITADLAVECLKQTYDQPWFLAVGFTKPHLPWIVPKKYFDLYDPQKLILPEVLVDDVADTPDAAQFPSYRPHGLGVQTEEAGARRLLHAYLATISYMDAQLGKVISALNERDDAVNTVIVLWSDHGWHLGEKQCWSKFTLWDESTRNPLMISAPSLRERQTCSKPVQLLDIYPTLVDLCGLKQPESSLDGRSLVPLMENPQREWKWPAVTCNGRDSFSLTFEHWKYNRFFDGSEELYDLKGDPLCHDNLAELSDYEELKGQLSVYLPRTSHPNVSDGKEWMLWLEDYPRMAEWREEMEEIKEHLDRTGKVNSQILRRKCRAAIELDRSIPSKTAPSALSTVQPQVSLEEVPSWFKKLDADGDLVATKEEWVACNRKQAVKEGRDFNVDQCLLNMKKRDLNSDGVVTLKEYIGGM